MLRQGSRYPPFGPRPLFTPSPRDTHICRSTKDARSPQFPPVSVDGSTVVVSPDELAYWRALSERLGDPNWGDWANRTLGGAFPPQVRERMEWERSHHTSTATMRAHNALPLLFGVPAPCHPVASFPSHALSLRPLAH